jgi:hypothetical protein
MQQRFYWGDFMGEMRLALMRSEDSVKKKLSVQKPGIEAGIWIEQMTLAASPAGGATTSTGMPQPQYGAPNGAPNGDPYARYRNMQGGGMQQPQAVDAGGQSSGTTNLVTLVCRAVNLTKNGADASANIDMAHVVETEIKNCPMVMGAATSLAGSILEDDSNGTVTFTVTVAPTNAPTFTPGNSSN